MNEHPAAIMLDAVNALLEEQVAPTVMLWRLREPFPCDRAGISIIERPELSASCSEEAEWKLAIPVTSDEDEYGGMGTTVLCTTCLLSIINISNDLLVQG